MKEAGELLGIALTIVFAVIFIAMGHAFLTVSFQGNWWMLWGFTIVFVGCCFLAWLDYKKRN